MTGAPIDCVFAALACRIRAVEGGELPGPLPRRLVRLSVLVEDGEWVLTATDDCGWRYTVPLAIDDVVELLPSRPPDGELH